MVDVSALSEAVAKFKENPYWAKYLNEAPSDKSKEFIKYNFYYSTIDDDDKDIDEVVEKLDSFEDELGLEDWKYLLKYNKGNQFGEICKEKIKELSE